MKGEKLHMVPRSEHHRQPTTESFMASLETMCGEDGYFRLAAREKIAALYQKPLKTHAEANIAYLLFGVYYYFFCTYSGYQPWQAVRRVSLQRRGGPGACGIFVDGGRICLLTQTDHFRKHLEIQPFGVSTVDFSNRLVPNWFNSLITGVEEASHLHLLSIPESRRRKHPSANDRRMRFLWADTSREATLGYHSEDWLEFAAQVVIHQMVQNIFASVSSDLVQEYGNFYKEIKSHRRDFIASVANK